tara:strand:+ start:90 stop:1088 length:999 start_codon:yes stop_codon:yes gene_type:complete
MKHPNTDTIYCVSYPRSGSSWFRYCFTFITETETDKELLYHSHSIKNDLWTLEAAFDVKNILLLRNYKEAIFSELNNIYSRNPIAVIAKLLTHIRDNPGILSKHEFDAVNTSTANWDEVTDMLLAFKAKQYISDFLIPNFPEFRTGSRGFTGGAASLNPNWLLSLEESGQSGLAPVINNFLVHQYHFALQLKNYYELLEYHDNVASLNPDNALIIRYEDLMQNPLFELNKVIDFMDKRHCATPEQISRYRNRLHMLVANIAPHKLMSINQYRSQGHMATSYKRGSTHDYHRQMGQKAGLWDKSFLLDTDRVLKNKNPELFNKYLSDYEEKAN